MADRIIKGDSGNDVIIQNNDASRKIEVTNSGDVEVTGDFKATTVKATNLKANDGTASLEVANSTGDIGFSGNTNLKIKLPSAGGIYRSNGSTTVLTESGGATVLANVDIDSSNTGYTGVKVVDQWRINSDYSSGTGSVLTSNWERVDNYNMGDGTNAIIGGSTKMTESSGVFTFPSTGVWSIFSNIFLQADSGGGGTNNASAWIQLSTNVNAGSPTWNDAVRTKSYAMIGASSATILNSLVFFDVTSTTTCGCQLKFSASANTHVIGDSDKSETYVIFTRYGDT